MGSRIRIAVVCLASLALLTACDPFIFGAGDIACAPNAAGWNGGDGTASACAQKRTSNLIQGAGATAVLTLGDTQYNSAFMSEFLGSYDPTWGRFKSITHPVAGNHDYQNTTVKARDYFAYFGASAGDPAKGYYSYDVGSWHVIALNSGTCGPGPFPPHSGACDAGSAQERWLRADLAAHPAACVLAYWHHPLFSSGQSGNTTAVRPLYQALYDHHADVVLNGHNHMYERFALQNPQGAADPSRGIREFVVGTGGNNLETVKQVQPNSEVRRTGTFGVIKLTLADDSYTWEFVPEAGKSFTDSGTTSCH